MTKSLKFKINIINFQSEYKNCTNGLHRRRLPLVIEMGGKFVLFLKSTKLKQTE